MTYSTFFGFIKRILLFQILLYYSLSKFNDIIYSQKEFIYKLKILFSDLGFHNLSKINLPENDDIFIRIILISIMLISILSILDYNIMKFISGLISISIGFIYYNPFGKINELEAQNIVINILNFYNYIPSFNLLLYISIGIAMIGQSLENVNIFQIIFCCFGDDCENERKVKHKRKCKFNCQFEFDLNNSSNTNSSIGKYDYSQRYEY